MLCVVIYKKTQGSLCGCAFALSAMSISAVYLIGWMARDVGVTIGLWRLVDGKVGPSSEILPSWCETNARRKGSVTSVRCNLEARL